MKTRRMINGLGKVWVATALLLCSVLSMSAQNPVTLQLEKSGDLSKWEKVEITSWMLDAEGRIVVDGAAGGEFYRLRIAPQVVSEGFALIPAGSFQMGDALAEGFSAERPVHTVNVSAFYMAKHETTKALWDEVRAWALNNGYTDLPTGGGKEANHPVHSVSWYEVLKWCNARSQKEGLTPCYTVGGAVYKTGENSSVVCNFAASGYRLPTEAERRRRRGAG